MEYHYVLTTSYDGDYYSSLRFPDAITAVETFQKCVDWGNAKSYATYNLLEPNGKLHTKNIYRDGKITGK